MSKEHDTSLKASGRIDANLVLRNERLDWGALVFFPGADGLRFQISMEVQDRELQEIEAAVSRIGLAVQCAVLAASGTAVRVAVNGFSYPVSPLTRGVGGMLTSSWDVEAFLDPDPTHNLHGRRIFESVMFPSDTRLPELYEVFWLGVRALQTIKPVVGLWAFSTILEDETTGYNLDHIDDLVEQMAEDGFIVTIQRPSRSLNSVRASAMHANPRNWMPATEEVQWFREAAQQYLAWRAEKGPSPEALRNRFK